MKDLPGIATMRICCLILTITGFAAAEPPDTGLVDPEEFTCGYRSPEEVLAEFRAAIVSRPSGTVEDVRV